MKSIAGLHHQHSIWLEKKYYNLARRWKQLRLRSDRWYPKIWALAGLVLVSMRSAMNFWLLFLCWIGLFSKEGLSKFVWKSKRNDKHTINAILKARDDNNLYGILGLRNRNRYLHIRGRSLTIPNFCSLQIPEMTLFYVTKKQIKRAYRKLALSVHPDKTADPRAMEAFSAVTNAAEILLDVKAREEYDLSIMLMKPHSKITTRLRAVMNRAIGVFVEYYKHLIDFIIALLFTTPSSKN